MTHQECRQLADLLSETVEPLLNGFEHQFTSSLVTRQHERLSEGQRGMLERIWDEHYSRRFLPDGTGRRRGDRGPARAIRR